MASDGVEAARIEAALNVIKRWRYRARSLVGDKEFVRELLAAADAVSPQPEYEQVGWISEFGEFDAYDGDDDHPWKPVWVRREDLHP